MLTRSLVILILRLFAAYQLLATVTSMPILFRVVSQLETAGFWTAAFPLLTALVVNGLILAFAPRIAGFFGGGSAEERLDLSGGVSQDVQRMLMQMLGVIFCVHAIPDLIANFYHAGWVAPRTLYPETPLATRLMQNINLLIHPFALTIGGFGLVLGADNLVRLLRRLRPMRSDEA